MYMLVLSLEDPVSRTFLNLLAGNSNLVVRSVGYSSANLCAIAAAIWDMAILPSSSIG